MRGNSFGSILVLTTFGESHGPALGAVIDGCPAGIPLELEDFIRALRRRRPGQSAITSARAEEDVPELLSGVFEGRTLGTPVAVLVRNTDARSGEYDPGVYRTGHADKVWEMKYGARDYRGGGRASGRETIGRVVGGVVAERILPAETRIVAFTKQIGGIIAGSVPDTLTRERVDQHETRCPDPDAADRMTEELLRCKESGDTRGGVIELRVTGLPAGLGEPVFRKAKSVLAAALMSVGAVAGVTLGDAVTDAAMDGIDYHALEAATGIAEHAAGIQGGITNGERIILRAYIKPVSTIGDMARLGRHDPCILPRAVPVLEAMAALALADLFLLARTDRAER
ncbi:MAG: chorismate synthase [Ignavibacteria bacterium]|nr:chorismate synthase [Ignavibacteria bacterium]